MSPLVSTGLSIGRLEKALSGQEKLDLIRFSGYKFRSTGAKGARRSFVLRARNEFKSAVPLVLILSTMTVQSYVEDVLLPMTLNFLRGVTNALY
ncbi:hypothetical protein TNCV_707681 [Trichonephila clavipes]|nr:hypothetical protein TNCV_707681 [Trichonephila clavipes]